ncbi:hypothetical protein PV417_03850 [Streptomyces sp. ME19-03-3]|nr:hypothetical protein [Streptomyces sp. ME19-03-3]
MLGIELTEERLDAARIERRLAALPHDLDDLGHLVVLADDPPVTTCPAAP